MSKKPALRPGTALGEGLAAVARDILGEAGRAVTDPALSADTAIHDFRKSIKRWRAFLRLAARLAGDDANTLRAEARDHARALSSSRDLRAALDALEDTKAEGGEISPRSYAAIAARIEELQSRAEAGNITPERRDAIVAAIAEWSQTAARWPYADASFAEITSALAKGYRRARRTMPGDWRNIDESELHEFRRRVIDHRYQMELIEPLWPKLGKLWVEETQRLRDALGRHRDLANLASLAGLRQPLARYRSRLTPLIERRQAAHLAQAKKIAARIFAEKPKAFAARVAALWQPRRSGKKTK